MSGQTYSLEAQLELLKKINRLKIGKLPIYDHFLYEGISIWSFYQHFLWRDIERLSGNSELFAKRERISLSDFFFGLWAFFISITSFFWFLLKRPKIIFLAADVVSGDFHADPKLNKIYAFLSDKQIPYAQFLHTTLNRHLIQKFFRRKRPVFYLQAIDFVFLLTRFLTRKNFLSFKTKNVDLGDFTKDEKQFIGWALRRYARRIELSVFKTQFLKIILKATNPRIIIMDDDYRHNNELRLAAKILGIKVFSFQHGRFNKYNPGGLNYGIPPEKTLLFDKYFVWNEFWKNKLINLSSVYKTNPNNVEVGGKPLFEKTGNLVKTISDDILTVLIPYETIAPKNEIYKYIKAILFCPKTKIIFKLRKDTGFDKQIEEAGLEELKGNPRFILESDLTPEIMEKVDIAAGTYSTMLYEMVEAGKPVAIMKTSRSEAEDMIEDGLASWLDIDSGDFCGDIKKIAETDDKILKKNSDLLKTTASFEDALKQIFKNEAI